MQARTEFLYPTGSTQTASSTSWYKVYSSDTVAPTLYWPSPGDGTTITGSSYNVAVSSNDDRAVKKIELYLDNTRGDLPG